MWNGELLRFAIDNLVIAVVGVAVVGLQYIEGSEGLPVWSIPLALAGGKVIDYIRGRLPNPEREYNGDISS